MDDITNSKLDLADMLNKVDYSFKDYIPSKDALMFINFIKEVEKDLENKTPISHLMALDHIFKNTKKSLILAHRGFSKCLDINCSINTNEGYKRLEDIKEGDIVLDRYSKETKVLGISKIHEDKKCYKFILQDKSEFINTFDHINIIYKLENNKFKELIITTEDLVKVFKKQRRLNYFIPIISNPIQYQYKKIDFDTYLYGYFLAKKDIDSNRFLELKNKIINQFSLPLDFIPNYILYNNVNVRISLIQGMLDANGYVNTNGDIVLKLDNNKLFSSLLILFRELSCIVRVVEQKNILIIKNVKFKPFRCKSKLKYYFKYVKEHLDLVGILDIQETDTIKTKCISVESSSKAFVFNNCYITHNTTLLGEYLILFLACFNRYPNFGDINYIMYVSDTIENGVKNLRNNIEYRYANSSFLQQLIPNQPIKLLTYEGGYSSSDETAQSQGRKFTDVRLEFKNVNNKTLVVKLYGVQTGIRGTKELGVRPQLCHKEGTLVCTELGWHKVEDYYKKGDIRKERGYEVKVNCTPFTEIVTNDHLYLCGFESKRFVHNKPEFSLIDIQFTKVSNIKLFENNVYICEKIDKEVKDNIDISDDEMRLVSYYYFLGDKSFDNIKFEIDRYDFDTINELKEILENKLNYKYTISQNSFYMIEITLLDYPDIIKETNFDKIELLKKFQYIDIDKQKVFLSLLDKISYTYLKSFEELVLLEFISKRCEIPYNITNYDKKDYKYRFIKCLTQSTKYFKEYVLKKIDYVKKSKEYSNFIPIETPSHIYNTMLGTSHNCILDDLLKDKDAKSDTIIEDINEVIYKSISKALHPQKQKMIWLGTPFNFRDPIYEASVSGAWDTRVFPICEKFPCEANEFKGSWEDRFPYDVVKYEYDVAMKQGKPDYFYQELMLQIIPQDNLVVPLDKIRYIDIEATKNPKFNYYITTDLAVRKNATNDQTVISIWAYNNNQDLILVDGFCGRIDPTDFIKKLFTYVSKYKPLEVGIEVTGQQAGFISFIQQEMYNTNVYFTIKEVKPTTDKFSRFLEVSPLYLNGKIYISKNINKEYYNEFIDEISKAVKTGFKSKHDDILDTHSQLLYLEKFAPSEEIFFEKNDEDDKYFLENYDIMSEQITNTIF